MDTQKFTCEKCGGNHPTEAHQDNPQNLLESSPEKLKSPYFIQEATLEKTIDRLREIEGPQKKIIVYVGVHPNEGTDTLTESHASAWAEKYGATVVCHPTESTPHSIWANRKPENAEAAVEPLPPELILDEEENAEKFSFDNKDTFVVLFHGTPLRHYRDPERPRGLEVVTSRYENHPEDFDNRRHPILFSKPAIMVGLEKELSSSDNAVIRNEVIEDEFQEDPNHPKTGKKDPLWYPYSPNTLIVEYFYKGNTVQITDPYIEKLTATDDDLALLSKENWHRQMNIGASYLNQDALSAEDIEVFQTTVVKDFEKILKHISSRLSTE